MKNILLRKVNIMKDIDLQIPEYDCKSDAILIHLMICTAFMGPLYGVFIGYFYGAMRIIWIFCSVAISLLLYFTAYKIQSRGAMLLKHDKPEYDPEKTIRNYIVIRKSLLSVLFAVAVGILFFFAAYVIRQSYTASMDHETTGRAKGYVYETVAAAYGFIAAYIPALLWFIPDDILYSPESSVLYYILPIGILIIPPVFMAVPLYIDIVFVTAYFVLFGIRAMRIKKYNREIRRLKQEAEINAHRARSRFD